MGRASSLPPPWAKGPFPLVLCSCPPPSDCSWASALPQASQVARLCWEKKGMGRRRSKQCVSLRSFPLPPCPTPPPCLSLEH